MSSSIVSDVVLVYPPHEEPIYKGGRFYTSIPLGIAYLAANLEKSGISVRCLDCNVGGKEVREVALNILESRPKVVGISVTSPALRYIRRLVSELSRGGDTSSIPLIAVGGPHIGADATSSGILGADAFFVGEADSVFADYCRRALNDRAAAKPGYVESEALNDLDVLPYPARHLFPENKYRFTSIAASRGCPFSCWYCGMRCTGYRRRNIANIAGEVDDVIFKYNPRSLDFVDDVFTLNRDYAVKVAETIGEHELPWACTTRADLLDEGLVARLASSGCKHISFGVESGNQEIRSLIGKDIKDESYVKAFKWCADAGIKTRTYALVGLPTETMKDVQSTFDFINSLQPDEVAYSPTIIYPNTRLMEYAIEHGLVAADAWRSYALGQSGMPLFHSEGLDAQTINELCYAESKRFYLSPSHIAYRMRNAEGLDDIVDSIMASIAFLAEPFIDKGTRKG